MSPDRILEVLLRLYPRSERASFGPLIVQAFNDTRRELSTQSVMRRLGTTAWMLWDVGRSGLSRRLAFPVDKAISMSLGAFLGAYLAGVASSSFFFYTPPESVAFAIRLGGAVIGAAAGATKVSRRHVHAVLGGLAAMSLGSLGLTLLNIYGPWFTSDILPWYFWSELALAVLGASLGLVGLVRKRPGILLGVVLGVWTVDILNIAGVGFHEHRIVGGLALAAAGVVVGTAAGGVLWTQRHLPVPVGMLVGGQTAGLMLGPFGDMRSQVAIAGVLVAGLLLGGLLGLAYERHIGRSSRPLRFSP